MLPTLQLFPCVPTGFDPCLIYDPAFAYSLWSVCLHLLTDLPCTEPVYWIKEYLPVVPASRVLHLSPVSVRCNRTIWPAMDSADSESVHAAVRAQGSRIHHQEEQLSAVCVVVNELKDHQQSFQASVGEEVGHLRTQIQRLVNQLEALPVFSPPTTTSVAPTPAPGPLLVSAAPAAPLARPDRFSGEVGRCRPFLTQCGLHFELHAGSFPTDRARVAFIITHLSGRAEAWATAEWARDSPICYSLSGFTDSLRKIFDSTAPSREAAQTLMALRQGRRRVADYAIEFRTLAADSGWNSASLFDAFLHGLSASIKDVLIPLDLPSDLDSLIALAIRTDNRLVERERDRSRPAAIPPGQRGQTTPFLGVPPQRFGAAAPPSAVEEPMQLGRARLSPEERQRRLREGRCIYCGEPGHFLVSCPVKDRAHR